MVFAAFATLLCSGWFLHLLHRELLHCRVTNLKRNVKFRGKNQNACMFDCTLPLWVVKGSKKDMAYVKSLSLSRYFRQ